MCGKKCECEQPCDKITGVTSDMKRLRKSEALLLESIERFGDSLGESGKKRAEANLALVRNEIRRIEEGEGSCTTA